MVLLVNNHENDGNINLNTCVTITLITDIIDIYPSGSLKSQVYFYKFLSILERRIKKVLLYSYLLGKSFITHSIKPF